MSLTSSIAIFFVIWWLCLFLVLPFGVRSAHEAGEAVGEGHDAGAPVRAMMGRKALATTILASAVFALVYLAISQGWFTFSG